MKKFFLLFFSFLILISAIIYFPKETYPVFYGESSGIEEFSNDKQCLTAVRRLSSAFPALNSAAVLNKEKAILCGITTDDKAQIPENEIRTVLYDIFPAAENLKLEINTKRAEDVMELSYMGTSDIKEKYISLRFDFLISED